jgi:O-antigen/teichoic acid export membrane protein
MGLIQKDAFRTMLLSYVGIVLGYVNKGLLFLIILSTEQIGLINLLISVGTLFAQFANFGTVYSTWKFLPFFKNKALKNHGFLSFILLIVGAGVLICSTLALFFSSEIASMYESRSPLFISYYLWALPIGISLVFYLVLEIYLRSFFKNIIAVVAFDIVLRVLTTIVLLLYWAHLFNFQLFVVLHSLIYVIPPLILVFYLMKIKEFHITFRRIKISKRFKRIIFNYSLVNYLNTLGSVVVSSLDVMMIASMVGLQSTGVYTTIMYLVSAIQVPYKSLLRISAPLVAEYWKSNDLERMQELYKKVSSFGLFSGWISFVFLWLNIDLLFSFLKPEFQSGIWMFFFLMIGKLVDMFFGLNGSIFTTSKKYTYDIYFTLFLIIAVVLLNLLFIPWWGGVGAAISTTIAIVIYNLGRVFMIWKLYQIHPFTLQQFQIIGLGLVTLLCGYFIDLMVVNRWIQLIFQSIVLVLVFVLPVYYYKLQPELVTYVNNGVGFIRRKLFKVGE